MAGVSCVGRGRMWERVGQGRMVDESSSVSVWIV